MAERLDILIDVDVRGSRDIKVLKGDLEDLGKAGKTGGDGVDKLSKSTGGLTGSLRGLVAGGLLAGAGAALFKFGRDAIAAASDVEEMQAKFNTVFGELATDVTADLETFADAANRSIFELQGFASTLQDTFVPLGASRQEAADLSVELVKLATDLGSFNNIPTSDVIRDIQAALTGSGETMKKYGIIVSQANIEQEALTTGLADNKNELDALTKAQAAYQLILKGSVDAQGDAEKTAESFANQTRGLKASFEELSVTIGQKLLPASSSAVGALTSFVDATTDTINATDTLSDAFKRGNISFKDLVRTSTLVSSGTISVGRAMRLLAQAQEENTLASGENAAAYAALARSQTQAGPPMAFIAEQTERVSDSAESLGDKLAQQANQLSEAETATRIHQRALQDQAIAEEKAADEAIRHAEALRFQEEQARLAAASMGDLFVNALDTADQQKDLNDELFRLADAAGAGPEQLAILAAATGDYSDEAIEAALKAAVMQENIQKLAEAVAEGSLTADQAVDALKRLQEGQLQNADSAIIMAENLDEAGTAAAGARDEMLLLAEAVEAVPDSKTFTYTFKTDVAGFNLPPGVRSEDVRFTQSGVGLQHGADFIVPPGFPNDSFGPIFVTSGERVQVTPAGATTNNNQSLTVNVNAGGGNAQDVAIAARDGLLEAAQALGIRGFN